MDDTLSRIKKILETLRDEAYDAKTKSTQANEMIFHRAEAETLDKVLTIIDKENDAG